jgi:hypothetical protein
MKPRVDKLAAVPITVIHVHTPCVWELKMNPKRLPRIGDTGDQRPCFVARDVDVPWVEFQPGIKLPGPPPPTRSSPGHIVRERFMELKTEDEALSFLNEFGSLSALVEAERKYGWEFRELKALQRLFSELIRRAPISWNAYVQTLIAPGSDMPLGMISALGLAERHIIQFHWKAKKQRDWYDAKNLAVIQTRNVVSAILTTIEIDHLRGGKFGACHRSDCPKFFEITSRHKRKYCSQACAHLVSVRRLRSRRRLEVPKRKPKKTPTRDGKKKPPNRGKRKLL